MTWTHKIGALMIALVCTVALGACGSSSGRSTADPAAVVPADLPIDVTVAVPDQDQLNQFRQIVEDFGGAQAWNHLTQGFNSSLAKEKLSWQRDIAPWIGNEVGLVADKIGGGMALAGGSSGASGGSGAFVFPTNNMSAAKAFAKQAIHGSSDVTYTTDGGDLLIGSPALLKQITSGSTKLTSLAQYASVTGPLSGDQVRVFMNVHSLAGLISSRLSAAQKQQLDASGYSLDKIPVDSAVGIGMNADTSSIRLDVVPHDVPHSGDTTASGTPDTVSGLPADSILAATLGAKVSAGELKTFEQSFQRGFRLGLGTRSGLPGAATATRAAAKAESMLSSLLPAMGPFTLAIGGSSILNLHGGLSLTPSSPAAATKLLGLVLKGLHQKGAPVTGTASDFSLAAGPYKLHVSQSAGKVLALLGDSDISQLLSPTSNLSSNPTYQAALKQLPSGAKVPVFLSFTGLAQLINGLGSSQDQQAEKVLTKLSYLAVGSGGGETRVVLGLR